MKTVVLNDDAHQRIKDGAALGAKNRHAPGTYARSLGRKWPDLAERERSEVISGLAPAADDLIAALVRCAPPISAATRSQLRALLASTDGGARADG